MLGVMRFSLQHRRTSRHLMLSLVYIHLFLVKLNLCMLIFVILIGTFIVNSLPALMLFDLGTSQYFVSQSFRKYLFMALGVLKCPLRVSTANEHEVSVLSVFHTYTFEIFGVSYPINLIPIPYGGCVNDHGDGLFE